MRSYTLDTNCLIDIELNRPAGRFVTQLLSLKEANRIDLALAASSASELQKTGDYLSDFSKFDLRRNQLGFGSLEILPPIMRWGVGFWGHGLWSGPELLEREQEIFETLFPRQEYQWNLCAERQGIDVSDTSSRVRIH